MQIVLRHPAPHFALIVVRRNADHLSPVDLGDGPRRGGEDELAKRDLSSDPAAVLDDVDVVDRFVSPLVVRPDRRDRVGDRIPRQNRDEARQHQRGRAPRSPLAHGRDLGGGLGSAFFEHLGDRAREVLRERTNEVRPTTRAQRADDVNELLEREMGGDGELFVIRELLEDPGPLASRDRREDRGDLVRFEVDDPVSDVVGVNVLE